MTGCSAPNCSNHTRNGSTFYRFPADSERRKQWLINCRRLDWIPTQNDRLCSYHFEENQIEQNRADGKKRLRPFAVPTIFGILNTQKQPRLEVTNMNGNNPIGVVLEVKPEPTEIAYLSQSDASSQCCNFESVNINAVVVKEDENMAFIPEVEASMKTHKCDVCTKSFNRRYNMLQHMKLHTGERNHKCEICSKSFQTKPVLLQHIKSHTNERNHKCDVCTMRFKTKSEVSKHMQRHTDERNYKCHVCAKSFRTRSDASLHMKCHTVERNHKCDVCTKSFKTKSEVAKHMKRHTDERNSVCYVCAKRFKTRHDVVLHLKSHTDERNHKCDICTMSFKTRNELVKHVKYHSDERNYKCDVCEKCFKTSNHVLQHMKSHSDERNYKCDVCGKSFKMRNAMVRHMISHSDQRNYKCNVCAMCFKTKHVLVKHMKRHECEICIGNLKAKNYTAQHVESNKEHTMQKLLYGSLLYNEDRKTGPSVIERCDVNVKQENVQMEVAGGQLENVLDSNIKNSNGVLLEAKPESTEVVYLTQYDCSSPQCLNFKNDHCKNEPSCPEKTILTKNNNPVPSTGNFFSLDALNDDVVFKRKLHEGKEISHKNHPCGICAISFETHAILFEHMKRHANETRSKHKCDVCARSFKTKIILTKHVQRHSVLKNYQCDVCAKRFKTKGEVVKHVKCHNEERTHKCDVCTKSFKTRDKMTNHMRLHADQRNYKCDVCTKSFKSKSNLMAHMQHHTDERKYKCDVCTKRFKTKCNMVQHMKSHANGRKHYGRIQCEHRGGVLRIEDVQGIIESKPSETMNENHFLLPIMDEQPKSPETIYLCQSLNNTDVKIEEEFTSMNTVDVKLEFSNANVDDVT